MIWLVIIAAFFFAAETPKQPKAASPPAEQPTSAKANPSTAEQPAQRKTAASEQPAQRKPNPFPADEQLTYNINWPTGLSLGEARLRTRRLKTESGGRVDSEFVLDAAVPGFAVLDRFHSVADEDLCSIQLDKSYQHGRRKADETTKFDASKKVATRQTKDGGKSEIAIQNCAKDAVMYLSYLRRELSQGRLPPHQVVLFGAEYRVTLQFAGTQNVTIGDTRHDADRINITIKGPRTDINAEAYFAKDAVRTPLLVRVPLTLATFSMELAR